MHALLFSDVEGSTAWAVRLGDLAAAEQWAHHDRVARSLRAQHHGIEIDRSDGFFLLFPMVADAAAFADGYHAAMAQMGIAARVGIHWGAVTLRENSAEDVRAGAKSIEVDGLAKPLAARVMALAPGGRTLATAEAAAELPAGVPWQALGHWRLRGFDAPIALAEIGAAGREPPPDGEKAYRVVELDGLWLPRREVPNNLPLERDAFVGRAVELRALPERLHSGLRLVTVLGVGGTGKTRFVRRYARAWLGDWPGGAYFCDLSEARSLSGICFAVASALEVPLGKDDAVVQLGHAIAGRGRCLVILDNFEQVVHHCAATLGHWLDRAERAVFVVTSRERLQLAGEEVFPLEPLATDTEAVALFKARALAQRPELVLGGEARDAIVQIARMLDGLPLAVELAAARTRVLSPTQILERLKSRFALLDRSGGAAARQASMRATIDWSWELLEHWEQAALAQCSVFEGGFTMTAAETVVDLSPWPGAPPVVDVVQSLVDKSLLRVWTSGGAARLDIDEPHFGIYLTIQTYAAEKLASGGGDSVRAAELRHGHHFAQLGEEHAIEALHRHGGGARLRRISMELENLTVACRRATERADMGTAVLACRAAWQCLSRQGPLNAARELIAAIVGTGKLDAAHRTSALRLRAEVLTLSGHLDEAASTASEALELARGQHDAASQTHLHLALLRIDTYRSEPAGMLEHAQKALALARASALRWPEADARMGLGTALKFQGDAHGAMQEYESSLAILRELGDLWLEAILLNTIGLLRAEQGQHDNALRWYDMALEIHRSTGNRFDRAQVEMNVANALAEIGGHFEEAEEGFRKALTVAREVGRRQLEGMVLANWATLMRLTGRTDGALLMFGDAIAIHREIGNRRSLGITLLNVAVLRRESGDFDGAARCLDEAQDIFRALGLRRHEALALGERADLLLTMGRTTDVRSELERARSIFEEFGDLDGRIRTSCLLGWLELAGGNRPAAELRLAEAESEMRVRGYAGDSPPGRLVTRLRGLLGGSPA